MYQSCTKLLSDNTELFSGIYNISFKHHTHSDVCLITVLRVLNKIPVDRSCLTMIFAFGYAVVQKTGLLFSLLAFAFHCIAFIFIEPKQNVVIWWILCVTFTYFGIILFSSFGIRNNQVRMNNRTYFSWKRSKTPFSNLYRNLLSFIQEH